MPKFFDNFGPVLKRLGAFVEEVRKDYRKFLPQIIQRFETEFTNIGVADFEYLHAYLVKKHFDGVEVPAIFKLLHDRHLLRFRQIAHNAFSAALESVPEVPNPNRARIAPGGPQRTIMARLTAAIKPRQRLVAYTAVPVGALDSIKKEGLLSALNLLNNEKALALARPEAADREDWKARVRSNASEELYHGPNVFFSLPDMKKIGSKHYIKRRGLHPVAIDLERLYKDYPALRVYGMELKPYATSNSPEERERALSRAEVEKLSSMSKEELWKHYNDPQGKYYASDVPHAALILPGGVIPAKYLRALPEWNPAQPEASNGIPVEPELNEQGGRELYGYMRATRDMKREIKIPLLAYLRMVVRQTPRNFERDFVMLVVRHFSGPAAPIFYAINPGSSPRSCSTCKTLNGRVLTEAALQFAVTALQPVLFHPNCVHRVEIASPGVDSGKVVTLEVLQSWIRSGTLRASSVVRTSFVNV